MSRFVIAARALLRVLSRRRLAFRCSRACRREALVGRTRAGPALGTRHADGCLTGGVRRGSRGDCDCERRKQHGQRSLSLRDNRPQIEVAMKRIEQAVFRAARREACRFGDDRRRITRARECGDGM